MSLPRFHEIGFSEKDFGDISEPTVRDMKPFNWNHRLEMQLFRYAYTKAKA